MEINAVLLAGGKGSRLWPLSNFNNPKQFIILPLVKKSGFQLALLRALKVTNQQNIIIITNIEYKNILIKQIQDLKLNYTDYNVIYESYSNNTGIAVYASCKLLVQLKKNHLTYFFPTDHFLEEPENFFMHLSKLADPKKITLLGEKIKNYCSNFGYLITKDKIKDDYFTVSQFIEKPDKGTITEWSQNLNIFKNLGIYFATPQILMNEFNTFYHNLPDIYFSKNNNRLLAEPASGRKFEGDSERKTLNSTEVHEDLSNESTYKSSAEVGLCKNSNEFYIDISYINLPVDKMIAEKSCLLNMYKISFKWQDIGSFDSLYQYCNQEYFNNCSVDECSVEEFNKKDEYYNIEISNSNVRLTKKQ